METKGDQLLGKLLYISRQIEGHPTFISSLYSHLQPKNKKSKVIAGKNMSTFLKKSKIFSTFPQQNYIPGLLKVLQDFQRNLIAPLYFLVILSQWAFISIFSIKIGLLNGLR